MIEGLSDQDLTFVNYDTVVAGLESVALQLEDLRLAANTTGVVARDQISILNGVSLESHLNPNAFTKHPSITGLAEYQAALEAASENVWTKITNALSELLKKVWTWLLELFDRREHAAEQLIQATEEIKAVVDTIEEAKAPETEPTPEEEQRFTVAMNAYTSLTELTLLNPKFGDAVAQLIRKLPAQFNFMSLMVKHYNETISDTIRDSQGNPINPLADVKHSAALNMTRTGLMPALKSLNAELLLPGLDITHEPLPTEAEPPVPVELAVVRVLFENAKVTQSAISVLRDSKAIIHTVSEMDRMIANIDRLADLAANYKRSVQDSKAASQDIVQLASRLDGAKPLSQQTSVGGRTDITRAHAEIISKLTRTYSTIERAGDVVLNDSLSFINSVRSFQNARVKASLSAISGERASALRTKLAAKLEEIRKDR